MAEDLSVPIGQRAARSLAHPLTRALLALTFTTGLVDAVCYLGLGRVFAANMTGNIVLLGFGVAGGTGLPVVAPIVSLTAFLLGACAGGILAKRQGERHARHTSFALAIEVGTLAIATAYAAADHPHAASVSGDSVIALLALAMGVRNATVRKLAVPDLTTTVLTLTLTGLAADSPLAGGSGRGSARRIAAVLAMFTGALIGAVELKTSLVLPLGTAAGLALITWIVYIPAARADAAGT